MLTQTEAVLPRHFIEDDRYTPGLACRCIVAAKLPDVLEPATDSVIGNKEGRGSSALQAWGSSTFFTQLGNVQGISPPLRAKQ